MAASNDPRWSRDLRFLIPTIISIVALIVPIIREDIINRPTSKEAQLLVTPAIVYLSPKLSKLTIEGRGFYGDVDKRLSLVIHCAEQKQVSNVFLIHTEELFVNGEGAFAETIDLLLVGSSLKSAVPGICDVEAYRVVDRPDPHVDLKRASSKFLISARQ